MESHPAQPAAHFVGSACRREPTCPYLRRRRCLFFHSEDEIASASVVGQDHGGSPARTPVPQIAEPAENSRSSPRYLRERPDAGDDDTAVLPRNTHEGAWPTSKPVPPSYQPEEDSTSTLGRGPIGPTETGSIEEALSGGPLPSSAGEQLLPMAMRMPDTRAMSETRCWRTRPQDNRRLCRPPATCE